MHISSFGRPGRPVYAVDANAKRPSWWVQVAAIVPIAIPYVTIAFLSAVALQQSGAGVTWTPPG